MMSNRTSSYNIKILIIASVFALLILIGFILINVLVKDLGQLVLFNGIALSLMIATLVFIGFYFQKARSSVSLPNNESNE